MRKGHTPPKGVQAACKRGLDLAPEYGGDGLTEGAKSRARSMANGEDVSPDTIKRMVSFFARHDSYTKESSPPSPGYVAWQLWGGDAGKSWANSVSGQMDADTEKGKKKLVGGNHGAWAHARRQAQGKKDPEAYASAVYGRIAGHKAMPSAADETQQQVRKSLMAFVRQSQSRR